MIRLRDLILEYSDEEKRRMGIPLNAVSRGGVWFVGDKYEGQVINGKFVRAADGETTPTKSSSSEPTRQPADIQRRNERFAALTTPPFPNGEVPTDENIMAEKVKGQGGSNPGGIYRGSDGKLRYVKKYRSDDQPLGEQLANVIYQTLGIKTATSMIYHDGKQVTYASEIIPDTETLGYDYTREDARAILQGFAADVLVGNWDVVGLTNDNILFSQGSSEPIRIDNGAAFLTRAQGEYKPEAVLDDITEYDGFRNPTRNRSYAKIYAAAGYSEEEWKQEFKRQVQEILDMVQDIGSWEDFIKVFNQTHLAGHIPEHVLKNQHLMLRMLKSRTGLLQQLADSM